MVHSDLFSLSCVIGRLFENVENNYKDPPGNERI